jgi:hypothetical protein
MLRAALLLPGLLLAGCAARPAAPMGSLPRPTPIPTQNFNWAQQQELNRRMDAFKRQNPTMGLPRVPRP